MAHYGTVNYCIRLVGPVTGHFIGELDPDRMVLRTTHRRVTEYIDLAQLLDAYNTVRALAGTAAFG